jgi:hypothetical protein
MSCPEFSAPDSTLWHPVACHPEAIGQYDMPSAESGPAP